MSKERKMILKMIEDGKITAEEGLTLLEAIEKSSAEGAPETAKDGQDRKSREGRAEQKSREEDDDQEETFHNWKEELYETTERFISSANKGATRVMDMLGKAMDKLQKVDIDDFDFSFGGGKKVTQTYAVNLREGQKLLFSTANGSIRCEPWTQGESWSYGDAWSDDESWAHNEAQIRVTGRIAKIKDEDMAQVRLDRAIERQETDEELKFYLKEKEGISLLSMVVKLPQWMYEELQLDTTNGAVQLTDIDASTINISTSNGAVRVKGSKGQTFEAQTSNGRIQFQEVQFDHSKLHTSNGAIQASGLMGELDCQTTNGSIRIDQDQKEASRIEAITSNGMVRMIYPRGVTGIYGEVQTKHGDIECRVPDVQMTEESEHPGHKRYILEQGKEKSHYVQVTSKAGSVQISEREKEDME